MINIWSEWFWLPPNMTWEDIQNGQNKKIVYPCFSDLWVQVPLIIAILLERRLVEKYCFKPLGQYFKISQAKRRMPPKNDILEQCYKKSTKLGYDTHKLAKKLDMSERQVERWWRLRRSQDKPSTLVKFCENMWKGSFYLRNTIFRIYVLWDKEWTLETKKWLEGYPHQGITDDIWWYYMVSSAFYWSLTISQFWDVRRKDFWQMFIHHIATVFLLIFSWVSNLYRVGSITLILHDATDILLEYMKGLKYAGFHKTVNVLFVIFFSSWFVMRLYLVPFYVMNSLFNHEPKFPLFIILCMFMWSLVVLNIIWSCMILIIVYKIMFSGEIRDSRSSSSENESN